MKLIQIAMLLFLGPVVLVAQNSTEVFFDFNKYLLNKSAVKQLNSWIIENPAVEVHKIYGYCDWKGTNNYNDTLSNQRVKEVYQFLKDKVKIRKDFESKGFGKDFEQSKIQAENRKVTIFYEINQETKEKNSVADNPSDLQHKIKNSKVGEKIKLDNINFYNMSPRILPRSKSVLFDLLCAMEENPNLKIEIQGHICCQLEKDATDLSTSRAKAIYNFLISRKINRKRLSYKGFGISNPIHKIPEKSEKEQEENRRVEIQIVEN